MLSGGVWPYSQLDFRILASRTVRQDIWAIYLTIYLFFAVPGLELRAFTLSHSTCSIFVKGFSR
jgi:hypothetical protein